MKKILIITICFVCVAYWFFRQANILQRENDTLRTQVTELQNKPAPEPCLGGLDIDIDPRLLDRFLQKMRKPI